MAGRLRNTCFSVVLMVFLSMEVSTQVLQDVAAEDEGGDPYNADVYLDVPQTIRHHGYPAEAHSVETTDGYLLTMHRIPRRRRVDARLPVFLHHGLTASSWYWTVLGPGKALAFLLADAGFDVWLGNARGNHYSRAHASLPPDKSLFWDFSFHEIGVYDLPAEIDYILNVTATSQLHYIGHSMGTTAFFVMASMLPDAANKVASMFALAPVAFGGHMKGPIQRLARYAFDLEFLSYIVGNGELLPRSRLLTYLARLGCELLVSEERLCMRIEFAASGGYDSTQFNASLVPLFIGHPANGGSTKTAVHYLQLIKTGRFQEFDHGIVGNIVIYNMTSPPRYRLENIKVPVHLYYGENDWTADPTDVNELYMRLTCRKEKYLVPWPQFGHMDFIIAKDADKLVYDRVIEQLRRSEEEKYESIIVM